MASSRAAESTRPGANATRRGDLAAWLFLAVVLLAVPQVGGDFFAYELGLYVLYGMVAQGLALTWGVAGFLSLGQALFFGLGAYLAGHALRLDAGYQPSLWFLPLSIVVPAVLAYGVARLVFARRHESGPYFALITLALVMFGFQLANQWSSVTGGFNGLGGIEAPFGLDAYGNYYYLIAGACLFTTGLMTYLIRAPLGTLWFAIAQNENRLQFFGFRTDHLKAVAFAVSAALGGLAGALFAGHQGIVTPQATSVMLSAELLIWTAVGGRRSPYGALLGAVAIGMLSTELRDHFAYWEVIIAVLFIAVVMRFPDGILGGLQWLWQSSGRLIGNGSRDGAPGPHGMSSTTVPAPPVRHRQLTELPQLTYREVQVRQNGVSILNGLTFATRAQGVHCIIGPNGAGKTSCFNVLTGRLPLAAGDIRFRGHRVNGYRADAMARLGVGRKFQIPSVFGALSVAENLQVALWANRASFLDLLGSKARGWHSAILDEMYQEFPFLLQGGATPAAAISQGQRQMLEFAMTATAEPVLFLLDEPCAGLSVAETKHLSRVMQVTVTRLRAAALVVEHDMSAVEALADHVYVFHQGRLLAEGSYGEIRDNPEVQAVYSGGHK